jgi:hypothetical protein
MNWFARVLALFRKAAPAPPSVPLIPHRLASPKIGGSVVVSNSSNIMITLEGSIMKTLTIPAHGWLTVKSPVLQPVWRVKSIHYVMNPEKPDALPEPSIEREIVFINEWDALEVVNSMIEEYARSRAYDMMTPEDLRVCTLPFPKRALWNIRQQLGLKAHRENENVSVEA